MTATRLYYSASIEVGQTIQLDKNASHHLVRVMRNRVGAHVLLFNGNGYEFTSELLDEHPKRCSVKVDKKILTQCESNLHIALLQGISRSDRMDACIQKSTELGVNTIIPVNCERSSNAKLGADRLLKKHEHWKQVMISACEQSGRCVLPDIEDTALYKQAITSIKADLKLVLDPTSTLGLKHYQPTGKTICILTGPEGGLSSDEINTARENGYKAVHLGPRILRTETAGPACIAAMQTLWGTLDNRA